jgi:hypothetical protein
LLPRDGGAETGHSGGPAQARAALGEDQREVVVQPAAGVPQHAGHQPVEGLVERWRRSRWLRRPAMKVQKAPPAATTRQRMMWSMEPKMPSGTPSRTASTAA